MREFMINMDIKWLIMSFCLSPTVVSLPQCTNEHWAVQCDRKRGVKNGGRPGWRGWKGFSYWKKPVDLSAGIFSPPPPSSKWDPQQGLLCLWSLFIYSCSPRGKHSPAPPLPLCLTISFSLKQDAFRESLHSRISSLTIRKCEYIQQHVCVCDCAYLISLSN